MTQKTIKALYKQPVNYKLIKDGYKTVNGIINAYDGMPKVLELDAPSISYTSDLQYNVDTEINGAPVIGFDQFTLPDDETCGVKTYCYAPRGINYNYIFKETVRHYSNFTIVGNPNITASGIVSNFSVQNRLQLVNMPTYSAGTINSFEFMFKIHTPETFTPNGRLLNDFNSYDDVKLEVYSTGMAFNYGTSSTYIYTTSTPISTNTDYWIRVTYSNGIMSLDYSTDGINYSVAASAEIASSNIQILSSTFDIGARYYGNQDPGCTWAGSIDLNETYIKINGSYYWLPYNDAIEEVTRQFPGILDSSISTDSWEQDQSYKLYQLKNQDNTDTLQLTENNITDTTQKYKQYIQQLTIPARDYKWYYNGIPQEKYSNYWSYGAIVVNDVAVDFTNGSLEIYPLNYMAYESPRVTAIFNIETGNSIIDCVFFDMYSNYENELSVLFSIQNGKFAFNTYEDPTDITYGITTLSTNTKYWVALHLDKNLMKLELYLLADNSYTKENLPNINIWTKELTFNIINPETLYAYSYIGAQYTPTLLLNNFNGKVYLDNLFATADLTTAYSTLCWEAYSYYNYIYRWYANKSLYTYTENQNYADTLDFSDSWLNVTSNWKTQKQYINSNVCLMPIDGGEIVSEYSINGIVEGTPSFNNHTGILTNCTPLDYVTLPEAFLPGSNSWEINIKVKTPSTINEMHYIMGSLNEYYFTIGGELSANNTFGFGITSTGSSWDIAWLGGSTTVTPSTWYWIKLSFDGTEYKFELSTDGENYNLENSVINSTPIYQNATTSIIHLGTQATGYTYWTGEIDLTQCQIKINNTILWSGVSSTSTHQYLINENYMYGCLYNYNDEGQEHQFDVYYDANYTQPILVSTGETYSGGTKVDTITIPAHKTWNYQAGGNWLPITYVDTTTSNYTYEDGNLVLTEYTGNETDVILPNAVL